MDNETMLINIHKLFENSGLEEIFKKSKLGKVGSEYDDDPFNKLNESKKTIYLKYMLNGLPILITRYNGKYGPFSKPFNNKDKLLRRINVYSDLLTRSINNDDDSVPLPQVDVLISQVIANEKSTGIKGGIRTRRKNRRNRRKTIRKRRCKTRSNRKRRSYRR
jgi:hypothetical protein